MTKSCVAPVLPLKISCYMPFRFLPAFEEIFEEIPEAVVLTSLVETGPHKGEWLFEVILDPSLDFSVVRALLSERQEELLFPAEWIEEAVPPKNWLKECYAGFPPLTIGSFFIFGSHIDTPPPADKVSLKLDAATAFGTGEHHTTRGCLESFDDLNPKARRVLDVGCGSGILAMAWAKKYGASVDAVDIDAESVRVARNNAAANGLQHLLTVRQSDGYAAVTGLYDVIFCNILARPLKMMAPDLAAHLAVGGRAVISGFLTRQERWVLKAHEEAGLSFVTRRRLKGWSTVVLEKKGGIR